MRRQTDWTDFPEIERRPATHQVIDVRTRRVAWTDTEAGCIVWLHVHQEKVEGGWDRYTVERQGGKR